MAVLVMEMLNSDVAFVLHTVNPLDRDEAVLSAEMAVGLGETLASGTRGSPWRFAIDKANGAHNKHSTHAEGASFSLLGTAYAEAALRYFESQRRHCHRAVVCKLQHCAARWHEEDRRHCGLQQAGAVD